MLSDSFIGMKIELCIIIYFLLKQNFISFNPNLDTQLAPCAKYLFLPPMLARPLTLI